MSCKCEVKLLPDGSLKLIPLDKLELAEGERLVCVLSVESEETPSAQADRLLAEKQASDAQARNLARKVAGKAK